MNGNAISDLAKVDKARDEESGDEEETPTPGASGTAAPAKKKKKKPKKKKTAAAAAATTIGAGGESVKQTSPPTVPVSKFYPSGTYPLGEIREYTDEYVLFCEK